MKKISGESKKKPNCKVGNVACGKKCQPKHYKCPSEKSSEAGKASDKFVDNILAITAETDTVATAVEADAASTLVSSPPQKTLASPSEEYQGHLAKLINIFDGEPISPDELKEAVKVFSNFYSKVKKIKKPPKKIIEEIKKRIGENLLSNEEIIAAIQWVSFEYEDYKPINKVLYESEYINESEKEYGEKIGTLLASCLKKLKGSELEYNEENLSLYSDKEYSTLKIRADRKIVRYLDIAPADLERFLKPYKEALDKREAYVEKTFAAATLSIDPFSKSPRVEIEIELLSEGKSSAILMEKFKIGNSQECEIMMPPGCKYEVIDVRQKTIEDWIPKITVSQSNTLDNYGLVAPKSLDEIESFISLLNSTSEGLTASSDYFKAIDLRLLSSRFGSFIQRVKNNPESFDSSFKKIVLRELPAQEVETETEAAEPEPKVSAEEFYNSSLALFSKESKTERRAKIKGLSNEKELRKIQLAEENEAWVFVRLKRELDRLEKKGGEPKYIAELKDLLSRILDGDEVAKAEGKERVEKKISAAPTATATATATALDKIVELEDYSTEQASAEIEIAPVSAEKLELIKKYMASNGIELFSTDSSVLASKAEAAKILNSAQSRQKSLSYDSPEFKSVEAAAEVASIMLRNEVDFKSFSEKELSRIFSLANEYILLNSRLENTTFEEANKAQRKFLYALNKEPLTFKPASGNLEMRGKKSIPPIPDLLKKGGEPVDESFRNFLEEASILIQVTPNALTGILKAGRIKNKYEEGTVDSIGDYGDEYYDEERLDIEKACFGLKKQDSSSKRPVYGYIESPNHLRSAPKTNQTLDYGEISIKLKDKAKERSTITIGDSFNGGSPTPMLAPTKNVYGLTSGDNLFSKISTEGPSAQDLAIDKGYRMGRNFQYIEAQIFGGVSLEDIEFVILQGWMLEQYPSLIALLTEYGVSYQLKA